MGSSFGGGGGSSVTTDGGGGGNANPVNPLESSQAARPPTTPNISAGGGFMGRTPFGTQIDNFGSNPSQMPAYDPAFRGAYGNNLVEMAYRNILGRGPDAAGRAHWQGQMTGGLTGQGLAGAFTSSPEFQRQQQFTRAYTESFRPNYQEFGPSGQYYQPIYQQRYTNYSNNPGFYQPNYGANYGSPGMMGYGMGGFNPFAYRFEEGGEIDEDDGIAGALR